MLELKEAELRCWIFHCFFCFKIFLSVMPLFCGDIVNMIGIVIHQTKPTRMGIHHVKGFLGYVYMEDIYQLSQNWHKLLDTLYVQCIDWCIIASQLHVLQKSFLFPGKLLCPSQKMTFNSLEINPLCLRKLLEGVQG